MHGDISASSAAPARRVVVCVPNWLGDSIMAMPALQAYCHREPNVKVTVLTKPGLAPLWRMHSDVASLVELGEGTRGAGKAARSLAAVQPVAAYVLPNSFRAALVPLLARIPVRVGLRGHRPPGMLNRVVQPPTDPARGHQVWEYLAIFDAADTPSADAPRLQIPAAAREAIAKRFDICDSAERPWVGLLPGAAYGPSKRWPATHFIRLGQALAAESGARLCVLGSKAEQPLCAEVAAGIGPRALSLAGSTTLPELAAILSTCRVVICNDSGGMHLSAAVGTPVVAIYGITDPHKTGPLGNGHRLIQRDGVRQARDLERDSAEARAILASITPDEVLAAARSVLEGRK